MANIGQFRKHGMETFIETFFDSGQSIVFTGLMVGLIAIFIIGAVSLSILNNMDPTGSGGAGYVVIFVLAMVAALLNFFYDNKKLAEERAKDRAKQRELEYMEGLASRAYAVEESAFKDGEYAYKTGAGTFSAKSPAGPGPGDTIRVLFEDKTPVYIALDDTVRITGYQVNEGGR